ncbi:hypothetical protein CVT24_008595 [Panaeolus cyanescens]|uniref:F-box domain-containing protein n=1 Tax=Panaeolus cyanescens TaxID=181874 RepID=A0A409VCW9_9AGAR|nr:hypothetical protein CVT24_008595 [Panaeolus cyanescens]
MAAYLYPDGVSWLLATTINSQMDQDNSRLYSELYDLIISFLYQEEQALRSCALVCRSWVPASRAHLFYHITLTGAPARASSWSVDTPCRRLFSALVASPHLASFIHKLSVREGSIADPRTYRWVSEEITFPPLLKKLVNLDELDFNFPVPGSSDTKTIWSTMVFRDISDALSSLKLQSFTIRQFCFSGITDVVRILDACRNLKTLQLDHVDVTTTSPLSTSALEHVFNIQPVNPLHTQSEIKTSLETLMLRSNSNSLLLPILQHARSPIDLTNLTQLTLNMDAENHRAVLDVLQTTPELASLELEIEPSFDFDAHLDPKDVIDLDQLPALKSLDLHVNVLLARVDPIPWLTALFSTARSDSPLADIALSCLIDKPPPYLTIQAFDRALQGWRVLDEVLSQSTFSNLKRFRLDFALDTPIGDGDGQIISDEFTNQLLKLTSKGVLEVDICEVR